MVGFWRVGLLETRGRDVRVNMKDKGLLWIGQWVVGYRTQITEKKMTKFNNLIEEYIRSKGRGVPDAIFLA